MSLQHAPLRHDRIEQLNTRHPLNRIALECLDGYPRAEHELGLVSLLKVALLEQLVPIPNLRGSPTEKEIDDVLAFLHRADPDATMRYLTTIGDTVVLDATKLDVLDITDIASRVLGVLVQQLALGAALPSSAVRELSRP